VKKAATELSFKLPARSNRPSFVSLFWGGRKFETGAELAATNIQKSSASVIETSQT
jgi:demethoxyubiquinone hydroxylase (CLK1/Coq7/Cat5 family)